MSSITTRHIRHDWPEWIDWHTQKSIKTMCGVKSQPHLCGIPGITKQDPVIQKGGKTVWGWCMRCVTATWPYLLPPALTVDVAPQAILDLHTNMQRAIAPQRLSYLKRRLRYENASHSNMPNRIGLLMQEIDKHIEEFGDGTSPMGS